MAVPSPFQEYERHHLPFELDGAVAVDAVEVHIRFALELPQLAGRQRGQRAAVGGIEKRREPRMAQERAGVHARLLGIAERLDPVRHGLGENAVVGKAAKAGLHEMERRGGFPRTGRPGEHGGALLARHRGGMKQHVAAAEDDLGVTVVDEVDALIQVPADVADRERTSGPEADQDSRRALEDEPSTRDLLGRFLGPAAALPHDVDELAR